MSIPLISRYGAIGAAMGTAATLIFYNLLLQVGLLPTSNFHAFDRRFFPVYLVIALGAGGLFAIQLLGSLNIYTGLPLAAGVSVVVLAVTKKRLHIAETFPELLRLPFMRLILA